MTYNKVIYLANYWIDISEETYVYGRNMLIMIYSCHKKLHMKLTHRVQIYPNDSLVKLARKFKSFCKDEDKC